MEVPFNYLKSAIVLLLDPCLHCLGCSDTGVSSASNCTLTGLLLGVPAKMQLHFCICPIVALINSFTANLFVVLVWIKEFCESVILRQLKDVLVFCGTTEEGANFRMYLCTYIYIVRYKL